MEWGGFRFVTFLFQRNRGPVVSVQPAYHVRIGLPYLLGCLEHRFGKSATFRPVLFNHCRACQSLQALLISGLITPIDRARLRHVVDALALIDEKYVFFYTVMGLRTCLENVEHRRIGMCWRGGDFSTYSF